MNKDLKDKLKYVSEMSQLRRNEFEKKTGIHTKIVDLIPLDVNSKVTETNCEYSASTIEIYEDGSIKFKASFEENLRWESRSKEERMSEERFLTIENNRIELSDEISKEYGCIEPIYDTKNGFLYCQGHTPYFLGLMNVKQIKFDKLFRFKDNHNNLNYTVYFDDGEFLTPSKIFNVMGIKTIC